MGAHLGGLRGQQPIVHASAAPQPPCVENRGVDSAANPYLAAAFLLAAGMEGVAEGLDPGEPVEDLVTTGDGGPPTERGASAP